MLFALARDGLQAIDVIREQEPDVVSLDIRMPVLDGSSAPHRIHESDVKLGVLMWSGEVNERTL